MEAHGAMTALGNDSYSDRHEVIGNVRVALPCYHAILGLVRGCKRARIKSMMETRGATQA